MGDTQPPRPPQGILGLHRPLFFGTHEVLSVRMLGSLSKQLDQIGSTCMRKPSCQGCLKDQSYIFFHLLKNLIPVKHIATPQHIMYVLCLYFAALCNFLNLLLRCLCSKMYCRFAKYCSRPHYLLIFLHIFFFAGK